MIFFLTARLIFRLSSSFLLLNASLAIAILLFTSVVHFPSSVIIDPRYWNLFTCSTNCPSITMLTVPPMLLFDTSIVFVFFMLIYISYFLAVVSSSSISLCSPCSELATIPWSSANLTSFTNFPPTLTPSSISSMASIIIFSAYIENSNGERGQPCLTPLPMVSGIDSPFATLITASWPMYSSLINLLSLQSTPMLFRASIIFTQFTLSKAFSKSTKHVYIIVMLYTPLTQHSHCSYCLTCAASFPESKLVLTNEVFCL